MAQKFQRKKTPEVVIEEIKASGLRGRGGAGFPDRLKVELYAAYHARTKIHSL